MKYRYKLVDRIPDNMEGGIVYHTEEFELAGLLCACGCGHRIALLVPDSHQVWEEDGFATVRPSIGVFDSTCKSHFFIRAGNIDWLPAFTGNEPSKIMQAQIARHVAQDSRPVGWYQKAKSTLFSVFSKIRAIFQR